MHRDIKPANILLVNGTAKLADFGLLRELKDDRSRTKTQGGTFIYMAPESIKSDIFSIHTDLFSFAVTYVELRQGRLPFSGKTEYQICEKIVKEPPELDDIFYPDEREVLLKALDKESSRRFPTCGKFVNELRNAVPVAVATAGWRGTPTEAVDTATDRTSVPRPGSLGKSEPSTAKPSTDKHKPLEDTGNQPKTTSKPHDDYDLTRKPGKTDPHNRPSLQQPQAADTDKPKTGPRPCRPSRPRPLSRYQEKTGPGQAAFVRVGWAKACVRRGFGVADALVMTVWFFAQKGAADQIKEHIEKKDYAEAMGAIQGTSALLLPNAQTLRAEVEAAWWSELLEPDKDAKPKPLEDFLARLDQFKSSFPDHAKIGPRRDSVKKMLSAAIERDALLAKMKEDPAFVMEMEVDRLLKEKKFKDAREVVKQNKESWPDPGKIYDKIASTVKTEVERMLIDKSFQDAQSLVRQNQDFLPETRQRSSSANSHGDGG